MSSSFRVIWSSVTRELRDAAAVLPSRSLRGADKRSPSRKLVQSRPEGLASELPETEATMFDRIELGIEFFEGLSCGGRGDRGAGGGREVPRLRRAASSGRLPPQTARRGSWLPDADGFTRRFSLCCGRDGCRHRATPPSVRFLGRRVYIGAVVIVASVAALAAASAQRVTGVPARTLRRWIRWWRGPFTTSAPFV